MEIETARASRRAYYIRHFIMLLVSIALVSGIQFTPAAHAAIRPSFMLDDCAWHSTDIVVASLGDTMDGDFTILEVLKGNLSVGSHISIPALAAFAPLDSRSISYLQVREQTGDPTYVTGKQVILFLKKPSADQTGWQPAGIWNKWPTSVVWIESDKMFAFRQASNPGPSLLTEMRDRYGPLTFDGLESQVRTLDATQDEMNADAENKDSATRMRDLASFVGSDQYYVRQDALQKLADAGVAALPALRRLLKDKPLEPQYGDIIQTMGKAGELAAAPDMLDIVKSELHYWRKVGPTLPVGWWNGNGMIAPHLEVMRSHEGQVYCALCALADMNYHGDTKLISDLRNFWDSLPQLNDKSGLNQVGNECDAILNLNR